MQAITTIGLDIAKSVFQVHGVDVDGQVARWLGGQVARWPGGQVASHVGHSVTQRSSVQTKTR